MSDNYRFRDIRTGQGPVNIGTGNRAGRDYRDNRHRQHIDNRGGHYAGRDYHDRRAYVQEGDSYDFQVGPPDPFDAMASGRGVGRLLAGIGMLIGFGGFGAFTWVVVSFMTSAGPEPGPGHNPFAVVFPADIPILAGQKVLPVAIAAVVVGGILAAIGAAMAKAARRRYDRHMRARRRYPY